MSSINFRKKDEDIYQIIKENKGLVIVYGVTCADVVLRDPSFQVDYFVDRRAKDIKCINGVRVIEPKDLENVAKNSSNRITIIICIGPGTISTTYSIYNDIVKLDIDADVFEYFTNELIFTEDVFTYKGKKYPLFEHHYNCGYKNTRMTERAIEISLAKEWIGDCEGEIVEIGAVTPYYFTNSKIIDVIDPTDSHFNVTKHKSMFDCDLKNVNILSISTIEHIGTGDYGFIVKESAREGLLKILEDSRSCFITFPFGYNSELDEWVINNRHDERVSILTRGLTNEWTELDTDKEIYAPYIPALCACGVVIIEKRNNRKRFESK